MKYVVPIEPEERAALRSRGGLRPALSRKIEAATGEQATIEFTRKELLDAERQIEEFAYYAWSEYKPALMMFLDRLSELIDEIERANPRRKRSPWPMELPETGKPLFQFKITLLDIRPEIWRRIQTEDCTLKRLHDHIQRAFGWEDYHLHQFRIAGYLFAPPADDFFEPEPDMQDEADFILSELLEIRPERARWLYEYDFGDDWRHEIVFEGYPPRAPKTKYPLCLEGARACPPEDCGGPWGYMNLLHVLADEEHPDHDDMLEWCGPLEPEQFDAAAATRAMRRSR